jgi:small-conductance mechanosensitive channel
MLSSLSNALTDLMTPQTIKTAIKVLLIIFAGYPLLRVISGALGRSIGKKKKSLQTEMLVKRGIYYIGMAVILISVLNEFGFRISVLLGALGIFGIAIGFASQTSVSNIISGLFLITEKPFEIGDIVQVGSTVGTVLSVDFLSVKLRTFDNRFVRIPNEVIIKTEMINISRFPIRRLDLDIGVAYKEDIRKVIDILRDIAGKNPYCLEEPEPMIFFNNFGDSALEIRFAVWFEKSDLLNLRKSLLIEVKERFDTEGIEIPFPHLSLYTGEATNPMPVRLVTEGKESKPG